MHNVNPFIVMLKQYMLSDRIFSRVIQRASIVPISLSIRYVRYVTASPVEVFDLHSGLHLHDCQVDASQVKWKHDHNSWTEDRRDIGFHHYWMWNKLELLFPDYLWATSIVFELWAPKHKRPRNVYPPSWSGIMPHRCKRNKCPQEPRP
jgi:hypothetical protein